MKDIWIVGDHLLRDTYPYLQRIMQNQSSAEEIYLQATYDVYAFYPDFTQDNVLSMVRNAVVSGLNSQPRFPSAIVILIGNLLLVQDKLFLPSELEKKVRWILREINSAITTRKSLLKPKCFTYGEPRIIWVKSFQTQVGDLVKPENLLKFNNLLRRICASKAIYTPGLRSFEASTARCYDRKARINEKSCEEMWISMSEALKLIDERDEHYFINKKVEERLKELKQDGELKFERKASTYLSVTGKSSFTEANPKYRGHGDDIRRNSDLSYYSKRRPREYDYSRTDERRHDEDAYRRRDYQHHHSRFHSR